MNRNAWAMGVLLAPILQTASGSSWLTVGILAAACRLLTEGTGKYRVESPRWLIRLRRIWSILVLNEALGWIALWWPKEPVTVPVILLLLACILASSGRERTEATAGVMLWVILALLLPMLLSGAREIRWEALRPRWQLTSPALIILLLTPTEGQGRWLPALLISVLAQGVLSQRVSSAAANPVWELSRSLSLFGTVKRFESLIAVAMTLGFFAYLSHGLTVGREKKSQVWGAGVAAAGLYLTGWSLSENLVAAGAVILEVMVPLLMFLKKNFKNLKKPVDK